MPYGADDMSAATCGQINWLGEVLTCAVISFIFFTA